MKTAATHWNSPNLQPQDPVTLGLCSQIDLDNEVQKSSKRVVPGAADMVPVAMPERAGTLLPTAQTIPGLGPQPGMDDVEPTDAEISRTASAEDARVFAKLQQLTRPSDEDPTGGQPEAADQDDADDEAREDKVGKR